MGSYWSLSLLFTSHLKYFPLKMSAQQKSSALKIPLEIKGGGTIANGKVLQVSWFSWLSALILGMSLRDKGTGNTQHYPVCRHILNKVAW